MGLALGAGILQIKDYANEASDERLLTDLSEIYRLLKIVKSRFSELVTETTGLDYFGSSKQGLLGSMKKDVLSERPAKKKIQVVSA
jgi:hypothetical protein